MDPFYQVIWHLPSTHSFHAPIQLLHSFHILFLGAVIWGAVPTAVLGRVKPTATIGVCYYRGRVSVVMLHFCDLFSPSHRANFRQTKRKRKDKKACLRPDDVLPGRCQIPKLKLSVTPILLPRVIFFSLIEDFFCDMITCQEVREIKPVTTKIQERPKTPKYTGTI
jgi:hypothetical protein